MSHKVRLRLRLLLLLLLLPGTLWGQDITSNLALHWALDDGAPATLAQDSTTNNRDGTLGAGATWVAPHVGGAALALNGTTTGTVSVNGLLGNPSVVTLALWVKPAAFPTTEGDVLSLGAHVQLRVSASTVTGSYYTGSGHVSTSFAHVLSTTAWTHLTYSVAAGSQKLYINGTLVASTTHAPAIVYTGLGTGTWLGRDPTNVTTYRYEGDLDDVRVYSRALTVPDIAALVVLGTPLLEMHLAFDQQSGTTAQDSTTHSHDGALGTGAAWGLPLLGASAVLLDGTTAGTVTVAGELTQPAAVTLAAWVWPLAFPTTTADVLTIGNQVALRVSASEVRGLYWTGTTWVPLFDAHALSTTGWTHLAYAATADSQQLYINGALVATATSAPALSYAGQGTDTYLGRLGVAGTTQRYQGLIDDARVYTSVLDATAIADLAVGAPAALAVQVVLPVPSPSFQTTEMILPPLEGIAQDNVGVTGVTWSCPTCTPTDGAGTCTPTCGAATTTTRWALPALTLSLGPNVITVTAEDASTTVSDTLTVTRTVPLVPGTCSHWGSPSGGGNGFSLGAPMTVAQWFALPPAAGSTLCLLDGTYTGVSSMLTPPVGLSGTAALPLTVQALNDGSVLLDGQHVRNPVVLAATNAWWVVRGLNGKNGLTSVFQFMGPNNRGTRLVGWEATAGQSNATIFTVSDSNTVVEDCAGFGLARVIFQGSGTVSSPGSGYRRCWGEWNTHPGGGTLGGACAQPGKDQFIENLICTVNKTGD